jgi:hypothetical protein
MTEYQKLVTKLATQAEKLYNDFQLAFAEAKDIPWDEGEGKLDNAYDLVDEVLNALKGDQDWESFNADAVNGNLD